MGQQYQFKFRRHASYHRNRRQRSHDIPIPVISITYETAELSCDWRGLFTAFYCEQLLYERLMGKWEMDEELWTEEVKQSIVEVVSEDQHSWIDLLNPEDADKYVAEEWCRMRARRVRIARVREKGDGRERTTSAANSLEALQWAEWMMAMLGKILGTKHVLQPLFGLPGRFSGLTRRKMVCVNGEVDEKGNGDDAASTKAVYARESDAESEATIIPENENGLGEEQNTAMNGKKSSQAANTSAIDPAPLDPALFAVKAPELVKVPGEENSKDSSVGQRKFSSDSSNEIKTKDKRKGKEIARGFSHKLQLRRGLDS